MKPFITVEDAFELTKNNNNNIIFIDTRFDLINKAKGKAEYQQNHIPEALFFDLEQDLSSPKTDQTGRHPLPAIQNFKELLENNALSKSDHIICYDDAFGGFTARLWYMLRTLGFEKVQILEGGINRWIQQKYPTTAEKTVRSEEKTSIEVPDNWLQGTIKILDFKQVENLVTNGFTGLIDSRDPERFRGEIITYDPVYGHIPGSSNRWWKANLSDNGTLRDKKELKKEFELLFLNNKPSDSVIYCGSGVTSCFNYAVMKEVGFSDPKLYIGSFSDWIVHTDKVEK